MAGIVFVKPYRTYRIGQRAEMMYSVAQSLVKRGKARWVDESQDEEAVVETAAPEAMTEEPAENAMKPQPRTRRKRKPTRQESLDTDSHG